MCSGSWRDQEFKAYNFNALGLPPTGGYLHPLLKVSPARPSFMHSVSMCFWLIPFL